MKQDVTASANWTVGDATIIRSNGQGVFTAVATGDTFVQATFGAIQSNMRPVSVFPNTPPLPTYEIWGSIDLPGAVFQILDGLVAGRMATSGEPPPPLPGYSGLFGGPNFYRLLGVPPGTYHFQVTRSGYMSQQGTVAVDGPGGSQLNLSLHPN
jgi:hypothetical protein